MTAASVKRHSGPRILFVGGTPRSGTTFTAELLGAHERIVLGVERFRNHYRSKTITLALFDRDRFFDLRSEDTALSERRALPNRGAMEARFDDALLIGDKCPGVVNQIGLLASACPGAVFLVVVRHPLAVARSWQSRADDPDDHWPEANDWRVALRYWSRDVASAADAARAGHCVVVANYDRLVNAAPADALAHLRVVLDALGAGWSQAAADFLLHSRRPWGFPKECSTEQLEACEQVFASPAWQAFCEAFAEQSLPQWGAKRLAVQLVQPEPNGSPR